MVDAGFLSSPSFSNFSKVNSVYSAVNLVSNTLSLSLSCSRNDLSGATGLMWVRFICGVA